MKTGGGARAFGREENTLKNHKAARIATFVLVAFGAITTVAGGIGLLTGAIPVSLAWLAGSPFRDYTVPALSLLILIGGSMLLAAATILTGRAIGVLALACAGLAMMIFEIVEALVIDRLIGGDLLIALVLQSFFFALGLAIAGLAFSLWSTELRGHVLARRHIGHA